MFHLIGFIVLGFIVGLLARAVMPGRDDMGAGLTILLGIAGAVLAGWFGRAVGWYGPEDGAGFILSLVGAVLVLGAYKALTRNRTRTIA
jgi:uncharacterized membrane protein YeaQ/YmgE (transglycosylase-associated protein family)